MLISLVTQQLGQPLTGRLLNITDDIRGLRPVAPLTQACNLRGNCFACPAGLATSCGKSNLLAMTPLLFFSWYIKEL